MPLQQSLDEAFPVTIEGLEMLFKKKRLGGRNVIHVEEFPPCEAELMLRFTTCDNVMIAYEDVSAGTRRKMYFLVHYREVDERPRAKMNIDH